MSDESIREGRNEHVSQPLWDDGAAVDETRVVCPRCSRATDSLKSTRIPFVGNFFFRFVISAETVVACPSCTRGRLTTLTVLSVPFSNILFPFMGILYAYQIAATYAHGHSDAEVAQAHRVSADEHLAIQQRAINRRKPPRREWLILAIIIVVIAAIWGTGYAYRGSPAPPPQPPGQREHDAWKQILERMKDRRGDGDADEK